MKSIIKITLLSALFAFAIAACEVDSGVDTRTLTNSSEGGIAGSLMRFGVVNNYLYTLNTNTLRAFSLKNPTTPVLESEIHMGFGMETLFPYKDKLFIGASNGMYVYDNSNPALPTYLAEYEHVVSCDPVVVDDNFAYVTLRGGTICRSFINQLDILNIEQLPQINQVSSKSMISPRGLAISGDILLVCEGRFGLTVMDVSNRSNPIELYRVDSIEVDDVIKFDDIVMLVGEGGFYQYRIDTLGSLQYISTMPI